MVCEHCGLEMVVIRKVEVFPGLFVTLYSCPFCQETEKYNN